MLSLESQPEAPHPDVTDENNNTQQDIASIGSASIKANVPAWDDTAFKQRVRISAERRNMTLRDVLIKAGVSQGYLDKSGLGRSSDVILRLAQVLDVEPAYLFGLKNGTDEIPRFACASGYAAHENFVRLSTSVLIIAKQLGTLMTLLEEMADQSASVKIIATQLGTLANLLEEMADHLSTPRVDRNGKSI